MSHVPYSCPSCSHVIKVPSQHHGKKVQCPNCKSVVDTSMPPAEPWYYTYADFYARFIMAAWAAFCLLSLAILGYGAYRWIAHLYAGSDQNSLGVPLALLIAGFLLLYACLAVLLMFAAIFFAAMIRVHVDMARQLRSMRTELGKL